MRRLSLAAIVTGCLLFALPHSARAYNYSYARIVRLSLVSGDVQISRPAKAGWEKAFANMPIEQGFTVATNDGRAEIQFEDGSTAWIAENTILQFTDLALSEGGRITKLTLAQGTASFDTNRKSSDIFSVLTPQLQITGSRHAEFRADVFNGGASVSVLGGEVNVDSPAGTKTVQKGEVLRFNVNTPDQARVEKNPPADEWDRWVQTRENSLKTDSAQSLLYANAPVQYGMADLATYGSWNFYPGYGYGWQPWGLWSGWAPFWDGYWGFYPGLGWTWISYEPWGWVPYHFGEWVYSPAFGWLWLPGGFGYWCPAPVHWYVVNHRVAWAPRPFAPASAGRAGANSPLPVAPQILLVSSSKKLGHPGTIRLLNGSRILGNAQPLPAPPLMNGKIPHGMPQGAVPANIPANVRAVAFRGGNSVLVPTQPGLASLRSAFAENSSAAKIPASPESAPTPAFVNAAPVRRIVPAPPPPLRVPTVSNPSRPGFPGASQVEPPRSIAPPRERAPEPHFNPPRSFSPPPPPPHPHPSGGHPH